MNRVPFGIGEWYHCYTRGVDKRRTFQTIADYQRFLQTLYLSNSVETVCRSDLVGSHASIFSHERGKPLVAIAAFCIMPNHFHLVVQEIRERGIAKFMQKLGTSYAMYFNIKNKRVGNLFVKPFRSRHISEDGHWMHITQYVHLNPAELFEPDWKKGMIRDYDGLEKQLAGYPYSSLPDYLGCNRPEKGILNEDACDNFKANLPPLRVSIEDAAEYYHNLAL